MAIVWCYRDYRSFAGGHLKYFDYMNHIDAVKNLRTEIVFSPDTVWNKSNPWLGRPAKAEIPWDSVDALFIAGRDWGIVPDVIRNDPPFPILNLIQGVRHADPTHELYRYLQFPATRICVSNEIKDAILDTGKVSGKVFAVPNGVDAALMPKPKPWASRKYKIGVFSLKNEKLGRDIQQALFPKDVQLFEKWMSRDQYLHEMSNCEISIFLPEKAEGFYLPALEAMGLQSLVVCPDCIGNRSFCIEDATAETPDYSVKAITNAAISLLDKTDDFKKARIERASEMFAAHSIERERSQFHQVLEKTLGSKGLL